jgi:hypothetical protein
MMGAIKSTNLGWSLLGLKSLLFSLLMLCGLGVSSAAHASVALEIEGRVIYDRNGDAAWQVPSEELLAGISVKLLNEDGTPVKLFENTQWEFTVQPEVTKLQAQAWQGDPVPFEIVYRFEIPSMLPTGTYHLQVCVPTGYVATNALPGAVAPAGGLTGPIVKVNKTTIALTVYEETDVAIYYNNDFLITKPGSMSGMVVCEDEPGNGVKDPGEHGVSGVKILLSGTSNLGDQVSSFMFTDADGNYSFENLMPGSYGVEIVVPEGDTLTPGTPNSYSRSIVAEQNHIDLDFFVICHREVLLARLGDFVWHDLNRNGRQDAGEAGIANVVVKLYNAANVEIGSTTTDANGYYLFENLQPGSYRVRFFNPTGWTFTLRKQGANTAIDSDADGNGWTDFVTLAGDETNLTLDAGIYRTGGLATCTPGGWGSPPSGNNPGMMLRNNFPTIFPSGLTIGGNFTAHFTSSEAVRFFLPNGGTPNRLTKNHINPTNTEAGVFGQHVLALTLNVTFSNAGITTFGLGNMKVKSGKLAGWTVTQVLALANQVLGGNLGALPAGCSLTDLSTVVDRINNNYVDGADKGFLVP